MRSSDVQQTGQGMDENRIRQIIHEELIKNANSGTPIVPRHIHDSVSSPKIPNTSVTNPPFVMGKIDFAQNKTYTLYFSYQNPKRLDLNGFTYYTGATNSSVMTVGVAFLSSAYYFQPYIKGQSAKEGGTQYPINGVLAQCSSNLYIQADVKDFATSWPRTDQFYILNAYTAAGTPIGTIQAQNLTATSIDLVVTNLASGWAISANFLIS